MADDDSERPSANGLPDKEAMLAPTHALSPAAFEDFTERLLKASVFCDDHPERVVDVHRWGRPGDAQQGIDFSGRLSDGRTASWQCKRMDSLTPADVRAAVAACTHDADINHLVFSGLASSPARAELAKYARWRLVDRRDLSGMLDALPLHQRRQVLDQTWGRQLRHRLMTMASEDAFLTLSTFRSERLDSRRLLHDRGTWVGRDDETTAFDSALERRAGSPAIVVVNGPGGRGKTRLISETLARLQEARPGLQILVLSPGRKLDSAAIQEVPHAPAVLVIDDAHQDPAAVIPLLHHLRRVDGTQLVLATRPSGARALRNVIASAEWPSAEVQEIDVGELSRPHARALVDACSEDLRLPPGAAYYFALQATHSPHVAVIAIELFRRQQLTAPIVVDGNFRQLVLARHQEVITADLEGAPNSSVRTCLAVFAALGPVDDSTLSGELASFCRVELPTLLRMVDGLLDRGVLVRSNGLTRVVPDVLADDLLEREAAVRNTSTGFSERLWAAFGASHTSRLVVSLAELDWRLTRTGGPPVFKGVWDEVLAQLRRADYGQLHTWLQRLGELPVTQPSLLMSTLEEIRIRLDAEADTAPEDVEPPEHWWDRTWTANDVRSQLPDLYGRCAINAPDLLETALDALWDVENRVPSRRRQSPGDGVIISRLAKLIEIPDATFPIRVATKVGEWLSTPPIPGQPSPASLFKPLLEKEESTTYAEGRKLFFQPRAVSVTAVRPLREQIRSILTPAALSNDSHRAATAITVLGHGLHQPTGQFNRKVEPEEVLEWEDDDLATVTALSTVASATESPLMRRLVRAQVSWTAEFARSPLLQHAALTLITQLDERGDLVEELLLGGWGGIFPSRRGMPIPTLDELLADRETRLQKTAGMSDAQRAELDFERVTEKVANKQAAHQLLAAQVVAPMAAHGSPVEVIHQLDLVSRDLREAEPHRQMSLWHVWEEVGSRFAPMLPDIVRLISQLTPGPLDHELHQLLRRWKMHDETGLLMWLGELHGFRAEVRLAIGTAFDAYAWADAGPRFTDLHKIGMADSDSSVRERFMMAAHPLLTEAPADTAIHLLALGVTPFAATSALQHASGTSPTDWGRRLDAAAGASILDLIAHTGWSDWTLGHIVGGVASTHPDLVLDRLLAASRAGTLPADVESLSETFAAKPRSFVSWLVRQLRRGEVGIVEPVVGLVLTRGLTDEQSTEPIAGIAQLTVTQQLNLAKVLRDVTTWPLRQPALARTLLQAARQSGQTEATRVLAEIEDATHLRSWGWVDGVSEGLDAARASAAAAATAEVDPSLRRLYEQAKRRLETHISELRRDDEDDDWPPG